MRIFKFFFLLVVLYALHSCAKIVSPNGGPKDEIAPTVLGSAPSNEKTQFSGEEITFLFDEYVVLDNTDDIIISPYMEERPKFKLRGKKLIVEFQEELKKDITYSIDFGEAIRDLNAGNTLKGLNYTFSTGAVLDSAIVKGNVINASNGEAAEAIIVGLYQTNQDTLFKKEPPLYITKTDKTGNFKIKNVAKGQYELIALSDQNFNYYFDLPNEAIAFVDEPIKLDTINELKQNLLLFEEAAATQVIETNNDVYGKTVVSFSERLFDYSDNWLGATNLKDSLKLIQQDDQLTIWYWFKNKDNQALEVLNQNALIDTVEIDPPSKNSPDSLSFTTNIIETRVPLFDLDTSLIITFNYLLAKADLGQIEILEEGEKIAVQDSLSYEISDDQLFISYPFQAEKTYDLTIPSNSIQDRFGRLYNKDIKKSFKVKSVEDYGTLTVQFKNIDSLYNYLYELRDKAGTTLLEQGSFKDSVLNFTKIAPGAVKLIVIEDQNKNGKWDSGNYLNKTQPESIYTSNDMLVKGNWESEMEMNLTSKGTKEKDEEEADKEEGQEKEKKD